MTECTKCHQRLSNRGCDTTYGVDQYKLCPDCLYVAYHAERKTAGVLAAQLAAIAAVLDKAEGK